MRFKGYHVFSYGLSDTRQETLKIYKSSQANGNHYQAVIPSYNIAVNSTTDFLDNASEEYPLLNFRDVTYFPLTWRFAVDKFGWDYAFDSTNGLVINSTGTSAPALDTSKLGNTSPTGTGNTEAYTKDGVTIVYPVSNVMGDYNMTVNYADGTSKTFSLEKDFSDAFYYFDAMVDTNGYVNPESDIKPTLEGDVFNIMLVRQGDADGDNGQTNILTKFDIRTGKVLSRENIPAKQVN